MSRVEARHVAAAALFAGVIGAVLVVIRPTRRYSASSSSSPSSSSSSSSSVAGVASPSGAEAPAAIAPAAPPEPQAPEPEPAWSQPAPDSSVACPQNMLLVDAEHCPFVAHRCADGDAALCHRYVPEVLCEGKSRRIRVCIDRLEYPNLEGVRPASAVSFADAGRACAAESKRLCSIAEWELACEGPEIWPLPIGVRRDPRKCMIDRGSFARERLPPAGVNGSCASTFGVLDLMGGVAEWVADPNGTKTQAPFAWALEGGSSASGRACRDPLRDARTVGVREAGFRCCVEPATPGRGRPSRRPAPSSGGPSGGSGRKRPLGGWRALHVPDPAGRPPASNSAGHGLASPRSSGPNGP